MTKSKQPLVTIITATKNLIKNKREDFFRQAVESVKTQTYNNIEHLIIDGDSDDGTKKLVFDLQKDNDNLIFYSQKDSGVYEAFNRGVELSKGKYIIFLNSDDFYHSPKGIEKCVEVLENSGVDFCFSEANYLVNNQTSKIIPQPEYVFRGGAFCHNTMMCKRDILEKIPFNTKYKICADADFMMKLFLNKCSYKEVLHNFYSFRAGGLCTSLENAKLMLSELKDVIKTNFAPYYDLTEKDIEKALKGYGYPVVLEKIMASFFDDKEKYWFKKQEFYCSVTKSVPINDLSADIYKRKTPENAIILNNFVKNFQPLMCSVDKFLYSKLNGSDKTLFIDFILKRFGGIDTCSQQERELLDGYFKKAKELYQSRHSIGGGGVNTPIPINIDVFDAKMISPTPIYDNAIPPLAELSGYYEYVHSFYLKEYIMEDFVDFPEGSVILDCGASIGDTTIVFKTFYPNSPIVAVECEEKNFDVLEQNVKLNNYSDVTAIKTFLSNLDCEGKKTIDTIVNEYNIKNVGLIKFDIEGAERFALDGALDTIIKYKPNLIIPIYHLIDDPLYIPYKLSKLGMPMEFRLKWVEKRLIGADCTLFVKFL